MSAGALVVLTVVSAKAETSPEEKQFRKSCGTCHVAVEEGPKRAGPNLWGVIGRAAGQVEGFKYSDALRSADIVWDEATLDQWITNAGKMVPGTTMMYRQRSAEKREKIIAYLKTRQ